EAGAERVDAAERVVVAARRVVVALTALAALPRSLALAPTAAPVLEELVEELLERRARRQLRDGVAAALDVLRGRDVDHRLDHLPGDVGDLLGAARQRRGRCRRQQEGAGRERGERGAPRGNRQFGQYAVHGIDLSWRAATGALRPRNARPSAVRNRLRRNSGLWPGAARLRSRVATQASSFPTVWAAPRGRAAQTKLRESRPRHRSAPDHPARPHPP